MKYLIRTALVIVAIVVLAVAGLFLYLTDDQLNDKIRLRLPERYGARLAAIVTAETVTALTQPDGIIILPLALVGTSEQPRITIDTDVVQSMVTEYLRRRGTEQVEDAARRLLRGIRGN